MRVFEQSICLTLLAAAVAGCYPQIDPRPDGATVRPVDVIELAAEPVSERLSLIGTTEPWREATLYFEVSGIVEEVLVEEGDVVEPGAPVARLVPDDYQLALSEARARLSSAQARLDMLEEGTRKEDLEAARADHRRAEARASYWRRELPRNLDLFRRKAITDTELAQVQREHDSAVEEEATAKALLERAVAGPRRQEVEAATADVAALTQTVAQAQRQLDKATINAPFRGRVEKRLLDEGAYVNVFPTGGVPVVYLADLSQVDAVISVPEVHRARVAEQQQVEIVSATDPQIRAGGKIVALGNVATPESGTYTLRVRVSNPDARFSGGMVVSAEIPWPASRTAIRIPLSVLLPGYGRPPSVLLVDPADNRVLARTVRLGPLAGDEVEITHGLSEGELLIVRGHDRVVAGDRVEPRTVAAEENGSDE
jgi:HlyD family secretion protein